MLTLGEESPARNLERVWERVKIESAFKKEDRLVLSTLKSTNE